MGGVGCTDVGMFYTAETQAMLIYVTESWVMSPQIWKALDGFHH